MPTEPPPEALATCLSKARERDWWRLVSWQPDLQCWLVPSRTVPGEYYAITRRPGAAAKGAWWHVLKCNCPAETSGRYLACWHKAAVTLRLAATKLAPGGDARQGTEKA